MTGRPQDHVFWKEGCGWVQVRSAALQGLWRTRWKPCGEDAQPCWRVQAAQGNEIVEATKFRDYLPSEQHQQQLSARWLASCHCKVHLWQQCAFENPEIWQAEGCSPRLAFYCEWSTVAAGPLGGSCGFAIRQFDIADRDCEFWIAQFWVAQSLHLRIHVNLMHVVKVFGVPFLHWFPNFVVPVLSPFPNFVVPVLPWFPTFGVPALPCFPNLGFISWWLVWGGACLFCRALHLRKKGWALSA